ncbi:MAG: hypothetical protein IKM43_00805 [Clostridia bacterium]|nr:hypothetical protein [Clostridia bacterium]
MKFTEKELHNLFKLGYKNKKITIFGCNSRGQRFETTGFLITNQHSLENGKIEITFGQKTDKDNQIVYAPFYTDDQGLSKSCFYIDTILDDENQVIYKNADYEKIKSTMTNRKLVTFGNQDLPSEFENLSDFIGQPVMINKKSCILCAVYYKNNQFCAQATTGFAEFNGVIDPVCIELDNNTSTINL